MAYWDSENQKIVRPPPEKINDYPGWIREDCGCCGGLEWGGEYPRECRNCHGTGVVCRHIRSGVLAEYPGGPFLGRVIKPKE